MSDWRAADALCFDPPLSGEEWAWQFLRRNPEYRRDWRWFQQSWQALEAAYGKPPNRDYHRWRQDPRAWRQAPDGGDRLLIECWMGQKWGFFKFPPDPRCERPRLGDALLWRPVTNDTGESAPDPVEPARVNWEFDLRLPLAAQLEEARRGLTLLQRRGCREGRFRLATARESAGHWRRLCRLLDARGEGAGEAEIAAVLGEPILPEWLAEAEEMTRTGYRRILRASQTDMESRS